MKKLASILLSGLFCFATEAQQEKTTGLKINEQAKGGNTYTGCGLGSMLFTTDNAFLLSFQATTNGLFGNQTFAISSGTSGCEKAVLAQNDRVEEFVASNMDQLSKEASMGRGEALDTLVELLEIENAQEFKQKLQINYHLVYATKMVQMNEVLNQIQTL
ncbi:DUF3015 family protein [Helicobacter kayseriensis]|uniref:DUF3015 family protein n=1 Tax=Helicobacter kayseriensis TaxID=2905877 RepID=UPI001E5954F0|nr:DUF3015 family protein [Helicobacter kayseriensis]MCE3047358.1 DUF3015 domain-containing protein [Helicobacter kayseriensis]MCE3048729.1 DUF3015 domain-containing protein [Helicobacter kayseriensis]